MPELVNKPPYHQAVQYPNLIRISIGRSVALKFAKAYPVALLARNPANYESIVKEIKAAGGQAIGISTDVSSESSVKNAFAEIQKEFKGQKLAAAIYNVGGRYVRKPFLELTLEEYGAGYEANGYGPLISRILMIRVLIMHDLERDSSSLLKQLCLCSSNLCQILHIRLP